MPVGEDLRPEIRPDLDPLEDLYNRPAAGSDRLPSGHPDQDPDIKGLEENFAGDAATDEDLPDNHPSKSKREDLRNSSPEEDEEESLKDQLQGLYRKAQEADEADEKTKVSGKLSTLFKKHKKLLAGITLGGGTLGIGMFMALSPAVALFKLDHILNSIDAKTFTRFNASFSGRSDKYVQAYIKLRLSEITNDDPTHSYSGDTLLFQADKVDTNNPIRDWYRTLRTGSFEKDLEQKTGMHFTSAAVKQADGSIKLQPAVLKFNNDAKAIVNIDPEKYGIDPKAIENLKKGKIDSSVLDAINKMGSDADAIVKVQKFGSNKEARAALKDAINDNTHFFNVLKRRHIRKDIENKTGISSWKIFEKTRDKISASKLAFQQKMIKKVLPDNKAGQFLSCILGTGPCTKSNDPSSPEQQVAAQPTGDPVTEDNAQSATLDANGNPTQATSSDGKPAVDAGGKPLPVEAGAGGTVAADATQAVEAAATSDITDEALQVAEQQGTNLIAKEAEKDFNPSPTKIWGYLEQFTKIFNNLSGGSNSKLAKFITNFRASQLEAIYATYQIMSSQGHSGELTADEFSTAMQTLNDTSQSEAWIDLNNSTNAAASAAANDPSATLSKEDYCKSNSSDQMANSIHYDCDLPGANRATGFAKAFQNSFIYTILKPIADVVNGIHNNPVTNFFSGVANFVSNIGGNVIHVLHLDSIISKLGDGVINFLHINSAISYIVTKLMAFMGASPIFYGASNQPGAVNHIAVGSAVTAENSTRTSGGVASTPTTLAYSNNLAINYEKQQKSNESVFDRYASIGASDSVLSDALFAVTNLSLNRVFNRIGSIFSSIPGTLVSVFNGHIFADSSQQNFNVADWAGVQTYDIPPQCMNLDPLDPNYVVDAVGVVSDSNAAGASAAATGIINKIRPQLTLDVEHDSAKFWNLVYGAIPDGDNQEDVAGAIYNCALLDQRVMGGLGYTSGFNNDGGLNSAGAQ